MAKPRVYALTANSSSRPAAGHPLHGSSAAAKMKAPASAAGPSRAAVAVRLRRLLPWVLLLAAGTSMVFQALEQPPVEAGLPSQQQQQQRQRPGHGVETLVGSLRHSLLQNETEQHLFPEVQHHFRHLKSGSLQKCSQPVGPPRAFPSLQTALQACLGHRQCTWVLYDTTTGSTLLCSGSTTWMTNRMSTEPEAAREGPMPTLRTSLHSPTTVAFVRRGCETYSSQAAAEDAREQQLPRCLEAGTEPQQLCPTGLSPIVSTPQGMACDVCGPSGYCRELKEASVLQGFDEALQQYVSATLHQYRYRAFNPTLVSHQGTLWVLARVSNATNCRKEEEGSPRLFEQEGDYSYISNHLLLCPLGGPDGITPLQAECRYLTVDVSAVAARMPGLPPTDISGFEDPRAFELEGRLHVLTFFYRLNDTLRHNTWRPHALRWFMPEAGRSSHMFVARLDPELRTADKVTVITCPQLRDKVHKNWMPLIAAGSLYFVTHAQPLTVMKPDLETGRCELVSREAGLGPEDLRINPTPGAGAGDSSSSGAVGSSSRSSHSSAGSSSNNSSSSSSNHSGSSSGSHLRLAQPDPEAKLHSLDAAFAAVLGGRHLHGGSPFVEVMPDKFLSIVHHGDDYEYGRIYSHHFLMVQPSVEGGFETAWLSEAFRLPEPPPSPTSKLPWSDVQFASGLLLANDSLYISYGSQDCHSLLAVIPHAAQQIHTWLGRGLGTQQGAVQPRWAAAAPSWRPVVKWEGQLFGLDDSPYKVATAVVSRWLKEGHNATASIFLRHLPTSPDDPHEGRNLARAGVDPDQHLVDTNYRNSLPTDVAITHGRLEYMQPAATQTWIPYISWQGAVNSSQLSRVMAHAAEVWVPTAFHRAALLRMGAAASQVRAMPAGFAPKDLYPADFLSQPNPRPDALEGAKSFLFFHRGTPEAHQGAELLLEAFGLAFRAQDDITLVLHAPPGERLQHAERLGRLVAKVADFQAQPGSPHVLLIPQRLSFGQQAKRVVAAADVVVEPMLSGVPSLPDLLLAMSCGKPVITAEEGPAADWLTGKEGYLIPSSWGSCNSATVESGAAEVGSVLGAPTDPGQQQQLLQQSWRQGQPQQAQQVRATPQGGQHADVCLQVDPQALAAVLRLAYDDTAGRSAKGQAAARAARKLVIEQGLDVLAGIAWRRVQAHLKGRSAGLEQQHRKVFA